ncbi:hypothetical protein ACFUVV_25160 [Streptomyces sp. NPDC057376]|uniref:hypothetical protein n=1 Tax=unclassified Streptomyces TaxID=2593676 RepID=UPI00093C4A6D|nr:hypothetical protein [Streptomyces sp. CB02414]OKI86236.1 hypothetical protein AMK11_15670 [Streptomyces sp. CB02414]
MIAIWWVIVVMALGVWWTVWRLVRYPGGWAYAFHEEHREARKALEDARGVVRELRRSTRREKWQALAEVKRAEWAYRRRVRQVESELERLRAPHRGERIEQLGRITLYEHTALISEDEVPLAGLHARFELSRSTHVSYVYLTQPDGRERMERYDGKEFSEETVRRFSVQIQNAAVAVTRLQERRASEIRACEAELREARKATEPIEAAQERLEKTRARHDADVKLPQARAALDDARSVWQDLTGRRPL